MKQLRFTTCLLSALLFSQAAAAGEADIKYRQATMKAIGGHMGAMGSIIKGEVSHTGDLPQHVAAMGDLAGMADHLFPEGSLGEKSKAKAAIWEQPEKFGETMDKFQDAAAALVAADTADLEAFKSAYEALGKTCKGCHEDFRQKKNP